MSVSFLTRSVSRSVFSSLLRRVGRPSVNRLTTNENYHSLCNDRGNIFLSSKLPIATKLLWPIDVAIRGMKTKGRLNLRCKDCYFVTRKGRRYVMCKTHPRHKQQAIVKDEKSTWILTHATQSKIRPWF